MRNLVQDGRNVNLPVTTDAKSGDYERVGGLNAVLIVDADASDNANCALQGCYTLSVIAAGALPIGTPVFWNGSAIDDVDNGDLVGHLISAISGAGTVDAVVRIHN
jgi:predicted RecA/RadA family phage recombinase